MKKKDASFWSDIKALDERLKREPDSFCFARLSEIYLKVGLVADALHTARTGVARHPGYLAGQRALGMACHASGLNDECRAILERVTAAMPEDMDAQKVLASLYVASGDTTAAVRAYTTVLEFCPDDRPSAVELDALLQGGATPPAAQVESVTDDVDSTAADTVCNEEEILELSESDIVEEQAEEASTTPSPFVSGLTSSDNHDPLSTLTLAELYEKQGFQSKALAIYRSILADDPSNTQLLAKVAELEGEKPVVEENLEDSESSDFEEESDFLEPEEDVEVSAEVTQLFTALPVEPVVELIEPETGNTDTFEEPTTSFEPSAFEPELGGEEICEEIPASFDTPAFESEVESDPISFESDFPTASIHDDVPATLESNAFAPLANKAADNVVDTLDGWLENIRRIKACR